MAWFRKNTESRASIENPDTPISSRAILEFFGYDGESIAGVTVNLDTALTVPAILAAIEFLSSTIASLPLNHFKKTDSGREKQNAGLAKILHDAVNDECTSFEWRKYSLARTLSNGRSITYIERDSNNRVINLFPIDPSKVKIVRTGFKKRYIYNYGQEGEVIYESREIIDIPFSLKQDGLESISPVMKNKDTIALSIAATNYGSKLFNNGGVPPFVLTGKFQSGKGLNRASDDVEKAIKKQSKENKTVLVLPQEHDIKTIGLDPEKSQLVDLKRFLIEEIARIFALPPVFLQDLTHGTFSNTEQQDLHLVKHTLRRWVTQIEQELNLKLFGRDDNSQYVEFNLDGLLRGDFATRMSGYATAIQNAILTPNEVRAQENRESNGKGDDLLIQGATVPLGSQITNQDLPADEESDDEQ